MKIDVEYYVRCVKTLQHAFALLDTVDTDTIEYDMYRSACIKEYEIILEQSGKLLRKVLKPYFHSSKEVDRLYYKDLFRHAVLRSLLTDETCERWLEYRDNRNHTAHDYGVNFTEETLALLPNFIADSFEFAEMIKVHNDVVEE
jgi:hypothetical protein